jgi:hypothetical protein
MLCKTVTVQKISLRNIFWNLDPQNIELFHDLHKDSYALHAEQTAKHILMIIFLRVDFESHCVPHFFFFFIY